MHNESNTLRKRPLDKLIHKWLDRTVRGLKIIDDFMKTMPYFQKHQEARFAVLLFFADSDFKSIYNSSLNVTPNIFYEIVREEFANEFGEHGVLISTLCSLVNSYQRNSYENIERFEDFSDKAMTRINELENEIAKLKAKE